MAADTIKLHTAGLVVVKNNTLLLAYSINKQAWYLPGGKVDPGETALQSICREIQEELGIELNPNHLREYRHISAVAYGEAPHIIMEQDNFLYELRGEPVASKEIGAIRYFSPSDYKKESAQVPGVLKVFEYLKADGLISE